MERRPARAISLALLWTASVVAATAVAMTAVGAIGNGIVDPGQAPLSSEEVDARLAAAGAAAPVTGVPSTGAPGPATPAPAVPAPSASDPVTDVVGSPGGTAVARCTAGRVEILSVSPAQGFQVHGSDDPGRVRFESDRGRVEMRIACVDGRPVATVRGDDD